MQVMMAAAHPYRETTGTGIWWDNTSWTVTLWDKHTVLAQTPIKAPAPLSLTNIDQAKYDYWYNLEFIEDFPQITHWYFGSFWTGRACISAPILTLDVVGAGPVIMGYVQFVDNQLEGQLYSIMASTDPVEIYVPLPALYADYSNLSLRLALAELVLAVAVKGALKSDTWQVVTSLVERERLAERLPTQAITGNWCLEQTSGSPRSIMCNLMGLYAPAGLTLV